MIRPVRASFSGTGMTLLRGAYGAALILAPGADINRSVSAARSQWTESK